MGKETLMTENSSPKQDIFSIFNVISCMRNPLIILVAAFCCVFACSCAQVFNSPRVQVEMKATYGEYLNTFDSTFIPDGQYYEVQTMKIFFTEDEQKRIIKLADSLNFWELPDDLRQNDSIIVMVTHCPCPCSTRIKTDLKDKTVIADCFIANESYRTRLRELEWEIKKIVSQKPDYKALERRHFSR